MSKTETISSKEVVRGYDFNNGIDYENIFKSYNTTGI